MAAEGMQSHDQSRGNCPTPSHPATKKGRINAPILPKPARCAKSDRLLGMALESIALQRLAAGSHDDACAAQVRLGEAVDGLRAATVSVFVPHGLLARAAFRRSVGDWGGAARDLDEVEEIAEPGPMRLFLCDMALERARLAFARIAAFAPLNGLIDDSPPKPAPPGAEESAKLADKARANLATARELIERCGYHR